MFVNNDSVQVGSSSDLTFGSNQALCGGISRALRSRKRDAQAAAPLGTSASPASPGEDEEVSLSAAYGILPGDREGGSAEAGKADVLTLHD